MVLVPTSSKMSYHPPFSTPSWISFYLLATATTCCALSSGWAFVQPQTVSPSIVRRPQRGRVALVAGSSRRFNRAGDGDSDFAAAASSKAEKNEEVGIRLNKVFKATHSRRQSDTLVREGRVSINGMPIDPGNMGVRVVPFVDEIRLDRQIVRGWEEMNGFIRRRSRTSTSDESRSRTESTTDAHSFQSDEFIGNPGHFDPNVAVMYEYIKYWKPRGVVCTTDRSIRGNLLDELGHDGYVPPHRVFPVGRLDKDTSGLILVTSDGRLPNSALRAKAKQPKTYKVVVDRELRVDDLEKLRDGIIITTVAQRDRGVAKALTAPTLPSIVEQTGERSFRITIYEGRNRQIRKMMDALDYNVLRLHRDQFMDIGLHPLKKEGDWSMLDDQEMRLINKILGNEIRARGDDEKRLL